MASMSDTIAIIGGICGFIGGVSGVMGLLQAKKTDKLFRLEPSFESWWTSDGSAITAKLIRAAKTTESVSSNVTAVEFGKLTNDAYVHFAHTAIGKPESFSMPNYLTEYDIKFSKKFTELNDIVNTLHALILDNLRLQKYSYIQFSTVQGDLKPASLYILQNSKIELDKLMERYPVNEDQNDNAALHSPLLDEKVQNSKINIRLRSLKLSEICGEVIVMKEFLDHRFNKSIQT